ncbi:MAG: VC1465 family Xer recombination activation factor [Pseudomonadota bacterium]
MEHVKRFRALLADLGLTHLEAAKLLHVSLRTLQNWLSGRHQVPYMAFKLVRLLRYAELPGKSWEGWHFSRGMLITPEGHTISGNEGSWWSMLVQRSRGFGELYDEVQKLRAVAVRPEGPRVGDVGRAVKALAAPVLGCYAGLCSPENTLPHTDALVSRIPLGNHGDNKRRFAS